MIVYFYDKCSTCQKALQFLNEKKVKVILKDIVKTPPSFEELEKMLFFKEGHLTKLLNTSGMLYREMGLSQKIKEMQVRDILTLLSQHGMLIKRPFLLAEDFGLTGFKEKEWAQKIG